MEMPSKRVTNYLWEPDISFNIWQIEVASEIRTIYMNVTTLSRH